MSSLTSSPPAAGIKRAYQPEGGASTGQRGPESVRSASPPHIAVSASSASSTFRNVSACNRCRVRKNRCDQRLPTCSACEKAGVRCVGYDPIAKREIPRSYVYFLETRLAYFEGLLNNHGIAFDRTDVYDADSRPLGGPAHSAESARAAWPASPRTSSVGSPNDREWTKKDDDDGAKIDKLVSNIGMVSVHGTSDARYLGSTSGISFARVVLAAIKWSVSANTSEKVGPAPSKPLPLAAMSGGSSMRDSYFGLQTKPSIKEAPLPDRQLADKLVHLYFEYANPQIPVLHRGEFMELVDQAYSVEPAKRTAKQLYWLNIVFAVGAGIIWGSSDPVPEASHGQYTAKRQKLVSQQAQPEEYHASAIVHLGSILSSHASDRPGGELEELQAVLLLAAFALLRPVAPGLWYIVGVAMRLAVDLGLHYEDGTGLETTANGVDAVSETAAPIPSIGARERGRREWMRDLRRRLWWCTYNFDRLVSTCVGRPFGITDQVVTTEFPSLLDDKYISKSGFAKHQGVSSEPSYKRVSYHYLRLRLLQSEILQVLQYQQAQHARSTGTNQENEFMHTNNPSPFLSKFSSFRSWRANIDQRLYEWMVSAPTQEETGVRFDRKFLVLNYWQAVTTLYRPSLSVPEPLAGELSTTEDVASPASTIVELKDDEDLVYMKCAEAGQQTLKLYRQLHRQRLVNYTYLATHHLFMAGISFLYAVWHSPAVRNRLTIDDFDFTVLAATTVLGDLMQKCPPAEACRDAFERMSKATVQMCLSTSGFGLSNYRVISPPRPITKREPSSAEPTGMDRKRSHGHTPLAQRPRKERRPPPQFDMDLRGLFPDDLDTTRRPSNCLPLPFQPLQGQQQQAQNSNIPLAPPEQVSLSNIPSQVNHDFGMDQADDTSNSTSQPSQAHSREFAHNYNADFMDISNLPGMDFLIAQPSDTTNPADLGFGVSPGLDLGFGVGNMALDFSHDWSDGQQFDLFDGFFFGNA
ncbi:hypothetical protein DV737_g3155, partial [Chaetothyriales sp. CBS 132003]